MKVYVAIGADGCDGETKNHAVFDSKEKVEKYIEDWPTDDIWGPTFYEEWEVQ